MTITAFRPGMLLLLLLPVVLCSCFTTRHVDHWVETHYSPIPSPKIKTKDKEYISITPAITQKEAPYSKTVKGTNKMLIALFYWRWKKERICTINQSIPISNFTTSVLSYANTKGLRDKIKGDKIELTLDQFPNVFSANDNGWMVFLILAYVGKETVYIAPENKDIVVSYKISKDGAEIKKGTITIADRNTEVSGKLFQGTEKMTWGYLDKYDANMKAAGKLFVDQLLTQLED